MASPYMGAATAQFYVVETVPGTTPTSPTWLPLRTTGGMPSITRESLISAELGAGREVASIRTGNEQVTGEYAIELSRASQDDLLAAAMTADWVTGSSTASIQVAVNSTGKTFTRSTGDFTTTVSVGDLVCFTGLAGDNAKPFIVTAVTPTVITGAGNPHAITTAAATAATLKVADKLMTGNLCKSVSILTWFKGKCGNPDSYLLTSGVEFTGFTLEQGVNAMVTGSFPFIGQKQSVIGALPAGSTFPAQVKNDPFSSVDVAVFDGSTKLQLTETFTITNENAAAAQFELGNRYISNVNRGLATNTFSLAGKLADMAMVNKFIAETPITVTSQLTGVTGAMAITMNNAKLTAATPEIGGPDAVSISIEGQATGSSLASSIVIQRLTY